MDKKMFRSILLIITYSVLLVLVLLKIDLLAERLWSFLNVMKPFFIGFAIAFVLNQPCSFFHKVYSRAFRGKGEKAALSLAVLSSYLAFVVVATALVAFVVPQIIQSGELFAANFESGLNHLTALVNQMLERLDLKTLDIDIPNITESLSKILNQVFTTMTNALGEVMSQVVVFTSSVISVVVTLVLSIVFSVYMLSGKERLLAQTRRLLRTYVPAKVAEPMIRVCALAADIFTKYVRGQLVEACILGTLCCIGMVILRLDYAPMISVIVGVSALIPVVGAYMGAILGAVLLLVVSPLKSVIFLIFLACLQQVEGNVIYPRVVGTSLGLPAIWVLTAVTVGGGMFGFLGILLSVPVMSLIYTLVQQDLRRRHQSGSAEEEKDAALEKKEESDS